MRSSPRIAALALVLGGCLTPSIPIPPPDAEDISASLTGEPGATSVTFTYPARENYKDTVVFIYNRNQGVGIITDANADGSVGPTAPVSAALGDQIVLTFQRDDQSVATCFRLRDGAQSSTDYCD